MNYKLELVVVGKVDSERGLAGTRWCVQIKYIFIFFNYLNLLDMLPYISPKQHSEIKDLQTVP